MFAARWSGWRISQCNFIYTNNVSTCREKYSRRANRKSATLSGLYAITLQLQQTQLYKIQKLRENRGRERERERQRKKKYVKSFSSTVVVFNRSSRPYVISCSLLFFFVRSLSPNSIKQNMQTQRYAGLINKSVCRLLRENSYGEKVVEWSPQQWKHERPRFSSFF